MKLIFLVFLLIVPGFAGAASGGYPLDHAPVDVTNEASLQRGSQLYVNYCMGCHSLEYQRYSRLAKDIGLSKEQVEANLILTPNTKIGETMENAMPDEESANWFGKTPPDLSVIARARGADYLYTYLRTFYLDDSRPLGVNNAVLKNAGMPHVLWELQGWQEPVYESDPHNAEHKTLVGFEIVEPGRFSPAEYDERIADLVNFLVYVGEPAQLIRKKVGFWVIGFLLLALVIFYFLKKEYWKDVH